MKQKILILFSIILIISFAECGRIANGTQVEPGTLPWHVKLEPSNGSFRRLCGGSLIRYNWVLTAGQCLYSARDVMVRLGVVDRLQGAEPAIFWVRDRNHIIVHSNYSEDVDYLIYKNDLGLVYLEESTEDILNLFDDLGRRLIFTIPLPTDRDLATVGKVGIASGFGFTSDGTDAIQSMKLQMVYMHVIELNDCIAHHAAGMISDGNLCTDTTGGHSTCIGDEGAPFVSTVHSEPTLIAVGSTGLQDCQQEHPAIFTSVAWYLDWILEKIDEAPVTDPTTTSTTEDPNSTEPPPGSGKCNCVCNCYTCPGPAPTDPTKSKPQVNTFWKN